MKIEKKYLWLPVKKCEKVSNLSLFLKGKKVRELDIATEAMDTDCYAYLDMSAFLGEEISFQGVSDSYLEQLQQQDEKPVNRSKHRPKIHFTADIGWINDPNGLVYHDGVYHLFFQHNPFGTIWNNMTWGHATSTDLIHWEQQETGLYPDETGTMFSGCGYCDTKNELGLGENTLLFYYTAAGNCNQWSQGVPFTQRLAISTDGGNTLEKSDRFFLPHIVHENRDPKVFWHAETNAYIMVLFLDKFDFAIYRSTDLQNWEQTQVLTFDKLWECPDLMEFAIDGDESNKKWVFTAADGYYHVGSFDGYTFTPESEMLYGYHSRLPYAAQSYAGIDKKIFVAWLRSANRDCCHTGSMAIPIELGLTQTEQGPRLTTKPVDAVKDLRTHSFHMGNVEQTPSVNLDGNAVELEIEFDAQATGTATLNLSGQDLVIDFDKKSIALNHETASFAFERALSLRVFLDYEVIEVYAGKTCYFAVENKPNMLEEVSCVSDTVMTSFDVHFLSSIC